MTIYQSASKSLAMLFVFLALFALNACASQREARQKNEIDQAYGSCGADFLLKQPDFDMKMDPDVVAARGSCAKDALNNLDHVRKAKIYPYYMMLFDAQLDLSIAVARRYITPSEARDRWRTAVLEVEQIKTSAEIARLSNEIANSPDPALLRFGAQLMGAGNAPPSPSYGGMATGPAFSTGSYVSGFNRVCTYNRMGSTVAITIGATDLCPLTLP